MSLSRRAEEHLTGEPRAGLAEALPRAADVVAVVLEAPPLVQLGDPLLAQPAPALDDWTRLAEEDFQRRLESLQRALIVHRGVGIAAPQIGWRARVLLLFENDAASEEIPCRTWIDPHLQVIDKTLCWAWEGCLSVPELRGWVARPKAVRVSGHDAQGRPQERTYRGWPARVFQHEFDHLEGLLFPYRVREGRHLVSAAAYAQRASWPADWPAAGARDTLPGTLWSATDA